jgi:hypothetical protein
MGGTCSQHARDEKCVQIMIGSHERNRSRGRSRRRWEYNIGFRGCGVVSSGSEYGPVTRYCEHVNEHSGPIKFGEFLD